MRKRLNPAPTTWFRPFYAILAAMKAPLVQTKLHIPHPRTEQVQRRRLTDHLGASHHHKLVLITAPAGFGKTTLATSWLTAQEKPVAWVSLDESDNDPLRFFLYVVSALHQRALDVGRTVLELLQGSDPPPYKTLLAYLINDLAVAAQPLILALDDYHLIHAQEVHDALIFLLENLPPQLQIVLISRMEPPLPVSRLRAKHQLIELGAPDLRFTWSETQTFLNQTMRLRLTNEQITQLESTTEGWITGLQLIALTVKSTVDANRVIRNISGDSRYIADYLVDEVLIRQPRRIERFLLQTSIFERISALLCDAVLQIDDSQQILEALEQANLFVIPLDTTRTWYRYHHLFAELLRHRLAQQATGQVEELHRSAARWFFEHGMIEDAIGHWLEARDYDVVTAYLNGSINDEILAKGKFRIYLAWLDWIPDAHLIRSPKLVLYRVFQLWEMQDLDKFNQQFRLVGQMLGPTPASAVGLDQQAATYHGIFAVVRGVVNCGSFATGAAADCFAQALTLLPPESIFWRTLALGATGFCCRVEGNYAAAANYFAQAVAVATDLGLVFLTFMYATVHALVHLANGQLEAAIATCKIPLALDDKQGVPIPFAGLAYTVMGILLYLEDDLVGAERHVRRGIELVTRDGDAYYVADGTFTLAQIYLARGDSEGAMSLMDEMVHQISRLPDASSALVIAHAYQAHVWISCHHITPARHWAANPGDTHLLAGQFPNLHGLPYFGIYCTVHESFTSALDFIYLTQARYELAAGHTGSALRRLDALMDRIAQESNIYFRTQVLIAQALALHEVGETDQAVSTVLGAISLVAPQPFFQLFVCEGQPDARTTRESPGVRFTRQRLAHRTRHGVGLFVEQVLSRMPAPQPSPQSGAQASIDELTPREIEVLILLAKGISYTETATALTVSENTVKTHLKHIYSKLDVTNRLQAVNKAKQLALIP